MRTKHGHMIVEKSPVGFRATVPCKVNLFLEVLGKRNDGYHSLDTVMMAVSLVDQLEVTHRNDDRLDLTVLYPEGSGSPFDSEDLAWDIPANQNNLVVRALDRLRKTLGKPSSGANIQLKKRIPAMAGLGGGSADAAAALVLGVLLWGSDQDIFHATAIASELGSDINFFLEGERNGYWLARCTGRGETIQPLDCAEPLHLAIVHPPRGCGTKEVFEKLGRQFELEPRVEPDALIQNLRQGLTLTPPSGVFNRLESAAAKTTDWIERSRSWIDRYDHHGQCMSGSGSARFCLCATRAQAEKIVSELRTSGGMRAYYAQTWQSSGIEDQIRRIRKES